MTVYAKFLGTRELNCPWESDEKYFAILDTKDPSDVAIVLQKTTGEVYGVCGCCVTEKYVMALPVLKQVGRYSDEVEPKKGGEIEEFLKGENGRQMEGADLREYFEKVWSYRNSFGPGSAPDNLLFLNRDIQKKRAELAKVQTELDSLKAQIPEVEQKVVKHNRIRSEGLPVAPSNILWLDTLVQKEE